MDIAIVGNDDRARRTVELLIEEGHAAKLVENGEVPENTMAFGVKVNNPNVIDLNEDEEFACANAVPTVLLNCNKISTHKNNPTKGGLLLCFWQLLRS